MKRIQGVILLFLLIAMLTSIFCSCKDNGNDGDFNGDNSGSSAINVTSDSLYVKKVENLPEDFIFGMDASCVPSLEAGGVKYYDFDGNQKDVYKILSEAGINYIRVRI